MVTIGNEVSEEGQQLVIIKAEIDEYAANGISYEAELNYDGITYEIVVGKTPYAQFGNGEISFSSEAEWVQEEKRLFEPVVEMQMKNLAEAIYNNIFDSYILNDLNFWEFPFLSADETINNILFKKGSIIDYYDSGKIKKAIVLEPVIIDALQYLNGTIYEEEYDYSPETGIFFYDFGKVRSGELLNDTKIGKYTFMKGVNIGYYESGKVFTAILVEPARINGILLMGGDAEDTTIDGTAVEMGDYLYFNEKGKLDENPDYADYSGA